MDGRPDSSLSPRRSKPIGVKVLSPTCSSGPIADVPGFREIYGRAQRAGASPTMSLMLWQALVERDVGGVAGFGSHTDPCDEQRWRLRRTDRCCEGDGRRHAERAISSSCHRAPTRSWTMSSRRKYVNFACGAPAEDASERVLSTVLFTDIVGSTEQVSAQGDAQWRHQLDAHDKLVDWLVEKYGGRRVKHTGDGVFALFDGPTKAARCGLDMVPALAARGIRIRVGVHTGECERRGDEWSGAGSACRRADRRDGRSRRSARQPNRPRPVCGIGLRFDSLGAHHSRGSPRKSRSSG